jgi:hypothetical protein
MLKTTLLMATIQVHAARSEWKRPFQIPSILPLLYKWFSNESKYSSGYPVSSKANGKMAEATHAAMRARPQSTNPPPVWKAEFEVWVLTKGGLVCVIMQTDTIP